MKTERNLFKREFLIILIISAIPFFTSCSEAKRLDDENSYMLVSTKTDVLTNEKVNTTDTLKETVKEDKLNMKKAAESSENEKKHIICELRGEVLKPDVYIMQEGDRINDLINKGGGLLSTASLIYINRAATLVDGMVVIIPKESITLEEFKLLVQNANGIESGKNFNLNSQDAIKNKNEEKKKTSDNYEDKDSKMNLDQDGSSTNKNKININTADETLLDTIPGVGPVTAKNIIAYREENGPFASIEEIKNVNRIGEKTFNKLKEYITVD